MTRRIQLTPQASNDLDNEFDYLAERNTEAARRFYAAAQETFSSLAEIPGTGVLRDYQNPQFAGMRMRAIKGFRNYLAFYLTTDDSIQVLRVLHGARDIERIFSSATEGESGQ